MANKGTNRVTLREHLLNFRSPIRWGFLGLAIAIILFCVEIWLSLLQVRISLLEGVVVMWNVVEVVINVFLILIPVIVIGIIGLAVYSFLLWQKHKSTDDVLQIINDIQKQTGVTLDVIASIHKDIIDMKCDIGYMKDESAKREVKENE